MNFDTTASASTQTFDIQAAQSLAVNQWTTMLMLTSIGFAPMVTPGAQITFETSDTQGVTISPGTTTLDQVAQELARIHQKMLDEIHRMGGELSAIFFCPHSDKDCCECRKPLPGMFLELSDRLKTGLSNVFAVGDSLRDLQATRAAGALPVLVRTGNGELTRENLAGQNEYDDFSEVPIHDDLGHTIANDILNQS